MEIYTARLRTTSSETIGVSKTLVLGDDSWLVIAYPWGTHCAWPELSGVSGVASTRSQRHWSDVSSCPISPHHIIFHIAWSITALGCLSNSFPSEDQISRRISLASNPENQGALRFRPWESMEDEPGQAPKTSQREATPGRPSQMLLAQQGGRTPIAGWFASWKIPI